MRKSKKPFVAATALFIVFLMSLSLTACGNIEYTMKNVEVVGKNNNASSKRPLENMVYYVTVMKDNSKYTYVINAEYYNLVSIGSKVDLNYFESGKVTLEPIGKETNGG